VRAIALDIELARIAWAVLNKAYALVPDRLELGTVLEDVALVPGELFQSVSVCDTVQMVCRQSGPVSC
jgi:hypothetical protein